MFGRGGGRNHHQNKMEIGHQAKRTKTTARNLGLSIEVSHGVKRKWLRWKMDLSHQVGDWKILFVRKRVEALIIFDVISVQVEIST